jgi:TonB family protein
MDRRAFTKTFVSAIARKLLVCSLMLGVAAAKPQTRDNTSWDVYTVKGEHFSMALPVLPEMQTSKEMRARPQKARQRRVIKCSAKGIVYTIQVFENPKPRLFLDSFILEQATASSAENLISKRNFNLDGIAAKEYVYPDGKGMVQFFATGDRLYDVRAYGASLDDPRIATFFHHLSLKKQEGAIEISESVQAGTLDASTGSILTGKQVTTKARLIKKPEPTYSGKARDAQITGTVVLKCVFAADGTVTNIRVIQGLPKGLTERAIEAARKIKFIPATKDGKNVSMWMQLEYNFNLY